MGEVLQARLVEEQEDGSIAPLPPTPSMEELGNTLKVLSEGLSLLEEAKKEIKKKLKKGIHYDKPYDGAKQLVLLKAGADQLAYLLGIEVVERGDEEIRDGDGNIIGWKVTLRLKAKRLGNRETIVSRVCAKDEPKAQGGKKKEKDKEWGLDMLLAMAFKRAWVYGVIQLTGLSDLFIDEVKEELKGKEGEKKATKKQISYLKSLLQEKGISVEKVEKKYGKLEDLTAEQASELIEKVKNYKKKG